MAKTSLGVSIAEALGKKDASVLGGCAGDEVKFGGTAWYIGCYAGRILQHDETGGSLNPLFRLIGNLDRSGLFPRDTAGVLCGSY
jgi:ATP-dependent Lon protease